MAQKQDYIIALIGCSGSGKTSVAMMLEKIKGYHVLKSYTTRWPRVENEWGHIFVSDRDVQNSIDKYGISPWQSDDVIAYGEYNNHLYWATRSQIKGKGAVIYVIEPVGLQTFKNENPDIPVFTIFLNTSRENRLDRLIKERGEIAARKRIAHDDLFFTSFAADWVVNADRDVSHVSSDVSKSITNYLCKDGGA